MEYVGMVFGIFGLLAYVQFSSLKKGWSRWKKSLPVSRERRPLRSGELCWMRLKRISESR